MIDGVMTTGYESRESQTRAVLEQAQAAAIRKEKRDGRLIGAVLILALLLMGSVTSNVVQSQLGIREIVHVFMLDQEGNATQVMRLEELVLDPPDIMVMYVLMAWTECIRQISSDTKVMADNQKKCDAFMTPAAIQQLEGFRAEQKTRHETGLRVEVTEPIVRPIPNTRSYTVEWQERTYSANGGLLLNESGRWKAQLTLGEFHTEAAKKARELRITRKEYRNLLGIVVDGITWDSRPLYGQTRQTEEK